MLKEEDLDMTLGRLEVHNLSDVRRLTAPSPYLLSPAAAVQALSWPLVITVIIYSLTANYRLQ